MTQRISLTRYLVEQQRVDGHIPSQLRLLLEEWFNRVPEFRIKPGADTTVFPGLMSIRNLPLSELRKPYERYAASGEINTVVPDTGEVIERVAAAYAGVQQDRLDGLTVDHGDWWFNLRPSNTEPLLRLNLEAADDEAVAARVAEVKAHFGL